MSQNKDLEEDRAGRGRFTDVTDSLLPLFSDPDMRGGRRWRETFGFEPVQPRPEPREGAFIVYVRRQSSSD